MNCAYQYLVHNPGWVTLHFLFLFGSSARRQYFVAIGIGVAASPYILLSLNCSISEHPHCNNSSSRQLIYTSRMSTDNRFPSRRQYRSVAFGTWKVGGARMSMERWSRADDKLVPRRHFSWSSAPQGAPILRIESSTSSSCLLLLLNSMLLWKSSFYFPLPGRTAFCIHLLNIYRVLSTFHRFLFTFLFFSLTFTLLLFPTSFLPTFLLFDCTVTSFLLSLSFCSLTPFFIDISFL